MQRDTARDKKTEAQGDFSTLSGCAGNPRQNCKLNSAPPSLGAAPWLLDRGSHHSDPHWGGAKTNSHVHSAHKMRKLSMGTDGHTGPNAFLSIICCCGSEMIILQFSFILELPIQCLIESFETSEGWAPTLHLWEMHVQTLADNRMCERILFRLLYVCVCK